MVLLVGCPVTRFISPSRAGKELEHAAATRKKYPVEEILVKPETSPGKHPVHLLKHGLVGEYVPEYVLLGIPAFKTSPGKKSFSCQVVLTPFLFVPKHAISLIYLLKLIFGWLLTARVGIRVILEGKFSEGFLYSFLTGIIRNAENLVVVFHPALYLIFYILSLQHYYSIENGITKFFNAGAVDE